MNDLLIKRRKWRDLKLDRIENGFHFKSITIKNDEQIAIKTLVARADIPDNQVFYYKNTAYKFPMALTDPQVNRKTFKVELDESWTVYFFNEIDWTQIQIMR